MTSSRTSLPVVVGRVRRAHGVNGELLVEVVSDVPDRFEPGSVLQTVDANGRRRSLEIVQTRPHRGALLVGFRSVGDRDAANELRGASLEISSDLVPEAPNGWYYHHELIGLRCTDVSAGPLGTVSEVIEDGGGLLLALDEHGTTVLVPFVSDYIRGIDLDQNSIEFDLPPGLLESCASPS